MDQVELLVHLDRMVHLEHPEPMDLVDRPVQQVVAVLHQQD